MLVLPTGHARVESFGLGVGDARIDELLRGRGSARAKSEQGGDLFECGHTRIGPDAHFERVVRVVV